MNSEILERLKDLNLNSLEASIYITLIKFGVLNGSQIAKKMNISRSSIYGALDNLYDRGIVYLIPGSTTMYKAEEPEILIQKVRNRLEESAQILSRELTNIKSEDNEKNFFNLTGYENFILKAKELLLNTNNEVLINTCIDLNIYKRELDILKNKGVRVIVFSYSNHNYEQLPMEIYRHPITKPQTDTDSDCEERLMMVSDMRCTLICSKNSKYTEMTGIYTENQFLANVISEHIHHDIYLLKLKIKNKKELVNDDILLDSLLERSRSSINLKYNKNEYKGE